MYGVISPMYLFILLQGLNPKLSGYKAALALYEREMGPKPEKVCHFVFFEHALLTELDKKHGKVTKEYSYLSLNWGSVECTLVWCL